MPNDSWGWLLITVAGGGILLVVPWLWSKRSKIPKAIGQARASHSARKATKVEATREELVGFVLARAEVLNIEIPKSVKGSNPAIVTYHPTGRRRCVFADIVRYRRAVEENRAIALHCFPEEPPMPVSRWSAAVLQGWLDEHRAETPEPSGP